MAGGLTISTLNDSSGILATQNGMTGIAKAWVNFGYVASAITVRASFNVSSVVRNGTGDYTVNFTTAFPDASYAIGSCNQQNSGSFGSAVNIPSATSPTASALRLNLLQGNGASPQSDTAIMTVACFR